ncbi:MAG TPA: hypothetical protein VK601_22085, partial [Kofleriaceae bacterium]|nr:hypothetical protein [Kofleriaceae bacterium]
MPSRDHPDAMPDAGDPFGAALTAISPTLASSGDTITLEGTFGRAPAPYPAVNVRFPGGATQPATVLGDHRATVMVPASATDGDLTVVIGDTAMSPLAFRHAPFPLAVGTFGNAGQPGEARPAAAPLTPRSSHTSLVIGGQVYVIGGISQGVPINTVERAAINADGSLGPFAVVGTATLVTARYAHTSAVLGNYLYVIGGFDSAAELASVERAAINADGTLGAFSVVPGVALVAARRGHTTEVIGDGLYVVGGRGGAGYRRSVERATIHRDGSLEPFVTVDAALTTPRSGHTSAVIGNQLYVVGGFDGQAALGSVERASIMPDGTLGAFALASSTALATPRNDHTSVVLGGQLYVVGGTGASGALPGVEQAALAADGSLGMFAAAAPAALLTASSGHSSAIAGNYLYVFGGLSSTGVNGVQRATINGDGAVHKFAAFPVTLITARAFHSSAVSGHNLYIAGGNGAPASVERAAINVDGSLEAFTAAGTLAVGRGAHGSAVIGGYLYIIGGGGNIASLERAPIRPDGSLGPFA